MKLNQYLVESRISQKSFAERLGVCQSTVHKYLYKETTPSGLMMMKIHRLTDGAVTVDDWINHFEVEVNGQG